MIEGLKKFHNWTNGKKTLFSAIILFGVYVARGVQQFFNVVVLDEATLANIEAFGVGLLTIGLAHKGVKRFA